MSTNVSTTELKTIPPRAVARLKMEEKPRLVRTSSIEKIKRFNTFICSQHYYILPALLNWLKSSQSGLQSSTERTIFLFRSVFNTLFHKLYLTRCKSISPVVLSVSKVQAEAKLVYLSIISNFYSKFSRCLESTFLLMMAVYSACALVLLQLAVTLYLMYTTYLPYGFLFLSGCIVTINHLCYRTTFHYVRASPRKGCK